MALRERAAGCPQPTVKLLTRLLLAYGNWEAQWRGRGWVLTGKIKAPALVALLAGVGCLQLREGCEGKVMFFCFQLPHPEDFPHPKTSDPHPE